MEETSRAHLSGLLERQRQGYLDEGVVSAATRRDRLERAIGLLKTHGDRLVEAMSADFGHRSAHQSLFTDVAGSIGPLRHAQKHLDYWMRPEKRKVGPFPLNLLGARARIEYQPLGVVGVISPWNFPVNLTFTPLAGVLAAGNRCMIKPSEYTPATSALMAEIFASAFDELEIAVVTGGTQAGADFAGLPFDHLLFTGATSVARHVMRAAADNLVPVTLELDNADYTSVINARHYERLRGYVDEARQAGAAVVEINPASEDFRQQPHHKLAPTLILDPGDELAVMQDEIFGPILPVKGYGQVEETVRYINGRPRPLGLYYFGADANEQRRVLGRTTSGGVTVNDVVMHVAQEDLPFGGVGPSGMGAYHGVDGFRTFSHARSVFTQSRVNVAELAGLRPPYGDRMLKTVRQQMR